MVRTLSLFPPMTGGGEGGGFNLLPDDTVFAHSGAQSAGVETEEERRPVLPFNAPSGLLQHLLNVVLLDIDESPDLMPLAVWRCGEGIETVKHLERAPLTDDDRALDNALQFPDVAGPVVFLQGVHGLLGDSLDPFADLLVEFGDKMADQKWNIFLALS